MTKVIKEIVAVTGTYTNKQGEEKKRYTKLGVLMENDKGQFLKIESIPVGWDGFASLYEPKEKEQAEKRRESLEDDIPW